MSEPELVTCDPMIAEQPAPKPRVLTELDRARLAEQHYRTQAVQLQLVELNRQMRELEKRGQALMVELLNRYDLHLQRDNINLDTGEIQPNPQPKVS